MNDNMIKFIDCVIENLPSPLFNDYTVNYWDLDRIYLTGDNGKEYTIRMWDITNRGIRYSVFEMVDNSGKTVQESMLYNFA